MENKYDNLPLDGLIRSIQDEAYRLDNDKLKKKSSTKSFVKKVNELRLMRESARRRLEKRERNHPSFFPIGCTVIYQKNFGVHQQMLANVEEYHGDMVVIRPNDSEFIIRVFPKDIIIHKLRNDY